MGKKVKVAIVGAGTAGLTAMGSIRHQTDDFVMIHDGPYGTTCARVGCMPSKALIQIADDFHRREKFALMGIQGGDKLTLDIPTALARVRQHRDRFTGGVKRHSTETLKEGQLIEGRARFVSNNQLEVNGEIIEAEAIIWAAGSRPVVPPAWQDFADRILTSDNIFEQEDLPKRMAVIGLGVIGLELGQALARMGIEVTGFEMLDTLGGLTDPAQIDYAKEVFAKDFPAYFGEAAEVVQNEDGSLQVKTSQACVTVDGILAALGRRPNVDNVGFENTSAQLDERGMPKYNPYSMQVEGTPIFIVGDANNRFPVVHEAGDDGRIAARNALNLDNIKAFKRPVPLSIAFTDPQIGFVGKKYAQLDLDNTVISEGGFMFGRPIVMENTEGKMRLYADKTTKKLVGAELFGPHVEHLAHELAWVMQADLSIQDMLRLPYYHPVLEEGLQDVVRGLARELYPHDERFELAEK